MQYESGVKRRDLKPEIFSMAGIQELVLTFLDRLSHDALRFNRKREALDARIQTTICWHIAWQRHFSSRLPKK